MAQHSSDGVIVRKVLTEAKNAIFEPLLFDASSKPHDSKFSYDLVGCLIVHRVEIEVPFSKGWNSLRMPSFPGRPGKPE
jgi:hypothetical protein